MIRVGWSREVSAVRVAPPHILAGLRAIDPRADLLYVGWGTWRLVTINPMDARTARACEMIDRAEALLHAWEPTNSRYRTNPGAFKRLVARFEWAVMTYRGIRPIAEYRIQGEPTSAIVDDLRRMDWMYRHITDDQLQAALDQPKEDARREARADMSDIARGTAAWRYLFTRSHWVGDPGVRQRARSGFTTQRTIQ